MKVNRRQSENKMDIVTGASGFIGSFLVKALIKNKRKVRALVRKTSDVEELRKMEKSGLEIIYGDLNDFQSLEKAIKGIHTVFHTAALLGDLPYKKLKEINVEGTRNLLEACKKNKIKRFIHFSSATVFGPIEKGNEESKCNPESNYGKVKYDTELVVKEYVNKFPITILRPPMVYGPNARANMTKWFKYIYKGYFMVFGKGNHFIEPIYIDDLVDATLLVLKNKESENKVYVIAGQGCTMNEFVNTIAKIEGVKKPVHIPVWLAYLLGFFVEVTSKILKFESPLTRRKVKNMTTSRSLDISKARKELGYEPKVSIEDGIRKTVQWCKRNNIF